MQYIGGKVIDFYITYSIKQIHEHFTFENDKINKNNAKDIIKAISDDFLTMVQDEVKNISSIVGTKVIEIEKYL